MGISSALGSRVCICVCVWLDPSASPVGAGALYVGSAIRMLRRTVCQCAERRISSNGTYLRIAVRLTISLTMKLHHSHAGAQIDNSHSASDVGTRYLKWASHTTRRPYGQARWPHHITCGHNTSHALGIASLRCQKIAQGWARGGRLGSGWWGTRGQLGLGENCWLANKDGSSPECFESMLVARRDLSSLSELSIVCRIPSALTQANKQASTERNANTAPKKINLAE